MTELAKIIQEPEKSAIVHATDLLTHYSFDLGDRTASQLTQHWLKDFSATWIRSAVIEALYQGRYKAVSVDQILLLWKRRNQPCYHFNYEFERLVCNRFPRDLNQRSGQVAAITLDNAQPLEEVPILSPANVEEPVPAWIALAEQIQRDESHPVNQLGSEELVFDPMSVIEGDEFEQSWEPSAPFTAKLEAEVETSIEHTAPSFNRLQRFTEEFEALDSSLVAAIVEVEETQPPIHQFTPPPNGSDFHSKLKAVAESGGEELV